MAAAVILARVLQWRLFQLQVDFGCLLKMNWSSSVAGFKKGKVAWLMIPGFWMGVPSLTGQPIWMFFGRRAEDCGYPPAHHRRRVLSTRVHQVQPCCHILRLSFWSVLIHRRFDSWYLCNLCVRSFKRLLAYLLLSSHTLYKASLK